MYISCKWRFALFLGKTVFPLVQQLKISFSTQYTEKQKRKLRKIMKTLNGFGFKWDNLIFSYYTKENLILLSIQGRAPLTRYQH